MQQEHLKKREDFMRPLLQQSASVTTADANSAAASVAAPPPPPPAAEAATGMSSSLRREQKMAVTDALFRLKNSSAAKGFATSNSKKTKTEEPPKTSPKTSPPQEEESVAVAVVEDPRRTLILQEILKQEATAAVAKQEAQIQLLRDLASFSGPPSRTAPTREQRILALLHNAQATQGSVVSSRSASTSTSTLSETASTTPSSNTSFHSALQTEILRLRLQDRLRSVSRLVANHVNANTNNGATRTSRDQDLLLLLARSQAPTSLPAQPVTATALKEEEKTMDVTMSLPQEAESKKVRGRTSRFPKILHQVLLEMELSHHTTDAKGRPIAAFSEDGKSFVIYNHKEFFTRVGATHFKMTSYASFQRQLNLYNFQKLHTGSAGGAYQHPLFLRDQPELLESLRRTKIKSSPTGK